VIYYISELVADTERSGLFDVLHASGVLESRVESKLAEVGLSIAKLAALHQLTRAGDSLPLGQLAERLSCVKSNVTQLVDRLEADGLVSREGDPNDRRSRLAVLTAAGRKAYLKGTEIQGQAEKELFNVLSADESKKLHELLAKLQQ
jgi:DNA-binding MarR family transcriptional regulator